MKVTIITLADPRQRLYSLSSRIWRELYVGETQYGLVDKERRQAREQLSLVL